MSDVDMMQALADAMKGSLRRRNEPAQALPMLIRWSPDAEVPSWAELAEQHPEVGDGGFLLIPEPLWPDPTAGSYSMGVFE